MANHNLHVDVKLHLIVMTDLLDVDIVSTCGPVKNLIGYLEISLAINEEKFQNK